MFVLIHWWGTLIYNTTLTTTTTLCVCTHIILQADHIPKSKIHNLQIIHVNCCPNTLYQSSNSETLYAPKINTIPHWNELITSLVQQHKAHLEGVSKQTARLQTFTHMKINIHMLGNKRPTQTQITRNNKTATISMQITNAFNRHQQYTMRTNKIVKRHINRLHEIPLPHHKFEKPQKQQHLNRIYKYLGTFGLVCFTHVFLIPISYHTCGWYTHSKTKQPRNTQYSTYNHCST